MIYSNSKRVSLEVDWRSSSRHSRVCAVMSRYSFKMQHLSNSKRVSLERMSAEIINLKDRIQDYQERCHSLTNALARCEKSKEKMKAAYEEMLSESLFLSSLFSISRRNISCFSSEIFMPFNRFKISNFEYKHNKKISI